MRRLAVILLALLALPAAAQAKGGDDLRVQWLTKPDGGRTWEARFALTSPNGDRYLDRSPATIRVVGAGEFPTTFDNGYYTAQVTFPAAGTYTVEAVGIDRRDPERFMDLGQPVKIAPAATARKPPANGFPWPILAVVPVALLAWFAARRAHPRAAPA